MDEWRTYCGGRFRVRTILAELRMSHWINAPVVERVSDGATLLDLSDDLWDLCAVGEEGDTLLLVMRKYPGRTNDIVIRLSAEPERYEFEGQVRTREELMAALRSLP
jgi:hypothetical protein